MAAQDREAARQRALERARQGDIQALGELLESFRPYVRVIVHALREKRLQSVLDESDLIQDALLEARRSFAGFRGTTVAELTVWLRQIVLRTCQRTQQRLGKGDAAREPLAENLVELLPDAGSSPSAVAIRHEQAARMAEALTRLPEEMQQVLLARHADDLAHAAIAREMGRTEGAVRMLYLRALRRLRESYRE